jgi:hypothetical protein
MTLLRREGALDLLDRAVDSRWSLEVSYQRVSRDRPPIDLSSKSCERLTPSNGFFAVDDMMPLTAGDLADDT